VSAHRSAPPVRRDAWTFALHGALTAAVLLVALEVLGLGPRAGTAPDAREADLRAARDHLAAARAALDLSRSALDAAPSPSPGADPPARVRVDDLVPVPDDPPAVLDQFAERLAELVQREERSRLVAYYDVVTRPLLPGFDDAVLDRVRRTFASYAEALKSVPWSRAAWLGEGGEESWRRFLAGQDRSLRAALARDLPPEKVALLMERFAVRVPGPGEPLPSPALSGIRPEGR
jgi:hypothetical protein